MKTPRLTALLLFITLVIDQPSAAQNVQSSRNWQMRDGSSIKGVFVKMPGDKLFIKVKERDKEQETIISQEWLTPQSLETAKALEGGMHDKLIDTILMMSFARVSPDIFPARTFDMGAPKETTALQEYEPYHRVKITQDFYLKETEVTWTEWNAVRDLASDYGYTDIAPGRNGYQGDPSGTHPVTEVGWWDAVKWCNLKSQIENKTAVYFISADFDPKTILKTGTPEIHVNLKADGYRLPTEAEWEVAWHCGGRPPRTFPEPDGWHNQISVGNTHPVRTMASATSKPLHDMLGNVSEWCWDWKGPLVAFGHVIDPRGPDSGPHRIFRGGSWADHPACCRPTYRGDYSPIPPRSCFIGFRPARNATLEPRKTVR